MFIVTNLDRRHSGYPFMKYYVTPFGFREESIRKLIELRNWCWETFGPGVERKYVTLIPGPDHLESLDAWAWHTEDNQRRIYLRGDEELALFKLKWL